MAWVPPRGLWAGHSTLRLGALGLAQLGTGRELSQL